MELFYGRLEPLVRSPKLGPVLWQLPPTFRRDDERLASALAQLPPGRHCFEFRHESWFADDVMQLLRQHGVALVIGDRPEVHAFQTHELTADWTFVRFHAGSRGARGNYSERELCEWAERLRSWPVREAFVYFNNDWEGFAIRNGLRLKELLGLGSGLISARWTRDQPSPPSALRVQLDVARPDEPERCGLQQRDTKRLGVELEETDGHAEAEPRRVEEDGKPPREEASHPDEEDEDGRDEHGLPERADAGIRVERLARNESDPGNRRRLESRPDPDQQQWVPVGPKLPQPRHY